MGNPYESVPDEALEAIIRDARNTLDERRRGVSPRTLPSFLSIDSPNFLGLGMSLQELVATGEVERNVRSFGRQDRPERERRLDYVIRLSVELTEILKATHFCTSLARAAIVDVIEGDWQSAKRWIEHFTFNEERVDTRERAAPLYARFRATLQEALDTIPKPEEPEKVPN